MLFTDEQRAFQAAAERFAREKLAPRYQIREQEAVLDRALIREMGALGLIAPDLPERYGGLGAASETTGLILEALAYGDFNVAYVPLLGSLNGQIIARHATPDLAEEWLPRIATGQSLIAIALTEPRGGSDVGNLMLSARRNDGGYVLNGEKSSIIPFLSHSFSAKLTDASGKSGNVAHATPYNFFHGPNYSDGCRAVITWAMDDWKKKGGSGKAKFVFMGDNHPFPNSPKEACLQAAGELGFEVLPPIQYSLRPGDFKAQCLTLRESAANYAFLANTGDGNIALLKSCATVDVKTRFLTNIWGFSEIVMNAVGEAANGVVMPLHVKPWGTNVPGMKTVSDIAKGKPRSTYYIAAVCTVFYAKEAMEWADKNGGITSENIRKGMTQKKDWVPAALDGMCAPATWTDQDHRSVVKVEVVEGRIAGGKASWNSLATIDVGRDAKWWGK